MPWPPAEGPRVAGLSFGVGGTNAHAVIEQAPEAAAPGACPITAWALGPPTPTDDLPLIHLAHPTRPS